MKIKRYIATDMRQAIRMVREEQGPDAVILSSRRLGQSAEIIAAVDYDQDVIEEMASSTPAVAEMEDPQAGFQASNEPRSPAGQERLIANLRRELAALRRQLEQQLGRLSELDSTAPEAGNGLAARLARLGIGSRLSQEFARAVSDTRPAIAWEAALDRLAKGVRICEDEVDKDGGIIALVGPTGVGKTTTVAKLAGRFALRHGRRHVALITTDTCRIGAREQLRTFGDTLGVPVREADSRAKLAALVQAERKKKLVLIDNAGFSQRDLRLAIQLADLKAVGDVKSYLVIAATTQGRGLEEIFEAYSPAKLNGCILTKLDEAASLGRLLEMLVRHRLPAAYTCDGQRVPGDIRPAEAAALVARAHQLSRSASDEPAAPPLGAEVGGIAANGSF